MAPLDLASCGLPEAWAHRNAWTVLDTDFQDGQHFLNTWRAWQNDPHRPRMLHYVGIAATPPDVATVPELAEHVAGLGPGFHRILLDQARVSLTLCVGDVLALLGEHAFQADTLFARAPVDKWEVQALARRSKRGCRFWISATEAPAWLQAAGFQLGASPPNDARLTGRFDPHWAIPTGRTHSQHVYAKPARCAIVGAGIAGASVAHALALRGWEVTVFDEAEQPAAGASGLPVGLAVPRVSADDNPRARLSRSGVRLLRQHAQRMLVCGQDWNPSGVTEHRPDGSKLWHVDACWIKPAALVRAWLAHPGIRFVGSRRVTVLRRVGRVWRLGSDQDLGSFETVVIANAAGSADLLSCLQADDSVNAELRDKLAALQEIHGTLSHGTYAQPMPGLPQTPVNGDGCFIPHVPDAQGELWCAGSTFETDVLLVADQAAQHAANMERLQHLLDMDGMGDVEELNRGSVSQWSGTRCVTHDRIPLVGPIKTASGPGLWLCAGMGSRGLSFSALCAELLVARLGAEPLPMEFSLSRSLDANRPRRRQPVPPEH